MYCDQRGASGNITLLVWAIRPLFTDMLMSVTEHVLVHMFVVLIYPAMVGCATCFHFSASLHLSAVSHLDFIPVRQEIKNAL